MRAKGWWRQGPSGRGVARQPFAEWGVLPPMPGRVATCRGLDRAFVVPCLAAHRSGIFDPRPVELRSDCVFRATHGVGDDRRIDCGPHTTPTLDHSVQTLRSNNSQRGARGGVTTPPNHRYADRDRDFIVAHRSKRICRSIWSARTVARGRRDRSDKHREHRCRNVPGSTSPRRAPRSLR